MWDIARSTGTPTAATGLCLIPRESGSVKISEKPIPMICLTSTSSAEDFPARLFQLLETDVGSQTPEARCSLKLPVWLRPKDLRICSLKMYPACLIMTGAGRLRPSSIRWTDWGILWNGRCLTAKIFMSPNPGAGCTLSDILTDDAGEKYFLSSKQQERLLYKSSTEPREAGSTPPKG